jgi:osmotically-inducible protein OsmY
LPAKPAFDQARLPGMQRAKCAAMSRENDNALAEAAANALTWYRAVAPATVTVTVEDGWLTLSGIVADLQQRGAAERAVLSLRGVRGVSNTLRVTRALCAIPHEVDR